MKYYSIGLTGHIGVEINLESNVTTEYRQEDNGSGVVAISQENEYYPFGMTMQGIVVLENLPKRGLG